jgi:hypothetical protein
MASAVPQASQIGSKVGLLFGDTWDCIGVDFDAEKCHSLLNYKGFPTAFQADDEGSIPFTRSNIFKNLGVCDSGQVDKRAACKWTNVRDLVVGQSDWRN